MARVNILESNGEVDEEEIKVVNSPKAELLLGQGFHLISEVSAAGRNAGRINLRDRGRGRCSTAVPYLIRR